MELGYYTKFIEQLLNMDRHQQQAGGQAGRDPREVHQDDVGGTSVHTKGGIESRDRSPIYDS